MPVLQQAPFVDLWLAETQSSIAEAGFVRDVLDTHRQAAPLWISFTLHDELVEDDPRLRSGEWWSTPPTPLSISVPRRCCSTAANSEVMEPATAADRAPTLRSASTPTLRARSRLAANAGCTTSARTSRPEHYLELATHWMAAGERSSAAAAASGPSTFRRCRLICPRVSSFTSTRASGGMADALASGASIRKDVGVQVPLRPTKPCSGGVSGRSQFWNRLGGGGVGLVEEFDPNASCGACRLR